MSLTYMFRFLKDDGSPSDYYGIAYARDIDGLLCEIDKYGDPCRCEITKLTEASICFRREVNGDSLELDELELGDSVLRKMLYSNNDEFKAPPWSNYGG